MNLDDIVAYIFQAEIYCPNCIVQSLPVSDGEAFDGWSVAAGVNMSAEDNLNEIAAAFGINREDEFSFDSDEFPKVVLRADVDPMAVNICGACFDFIDESDELTRWNDAMDSVGSVITYDI